MVSVFTAGQKSTQECIQHLLLLVIGKIIHHPVHALFQI